MRLQPMVGHQRAGLRPDGGERALRVVAADRPAGGPQRLRDRAHAAGRGVLVERGHQVAVRADLVPGHPRDAVPVRAREIRVLLGARPAPRRVPVRADRLAQRARRRRAPRPPPSRGTERGVHEQRLPRLDAEFPQVAGRAARPVTGGDQRSSVARRDAAAAAASRSPPLFPVAGGGPAAHRRAASAAAASTGSSSQGSTVARIRATTGRRARSARPSRPASRSPRR